MATCNASHLSVGAMSSKGAEYSKFFRRAGIALGKGNVDKAIELLQDGYTLATERGDQAAAQRFQADIQTYQRMAAGGEIDLRATP